jgi:ATP-dependent Clp protease adaptor protein ClpS
MDFVIETLTAIFNLTRESAEELVYKIHNDGSAVVAVLPYEMAEQKGIEVTMLARQHGFPLVVKLEIEE